ncbi:Ig-like domain-containing protein [Candidatus Uhrbacteria bacterium]|nr:Ig-like domain-containing protein [Candidatus Uhrbacteria bacterium]
MPKRIALLIGVSVVVLILIGGFFYYFSSAGRFAFQKTATFELQPQKIRGEVEIEPSTSFLVKSSRPVAPEKLKESLTIEPKVEMTVQSVDDTTFNVTPTEELASDTVYTVAIDAPLAAKKQSWAYQVIAPFEVISTIPGNHVNSVPIRTGIEITLNRETVPFQDYFEISPAIAGTFEQKEEKLIFVPQEPLAYKTIYTVKLKKGLKEKESPDTLSDDTVFTFETEDKERPAMDTGYLGFQRTFWDFVPTQAPVFGLSSSGIKEVRLKIYRFKGHEDFLQEYSRITNEREQWSNFHNLLEFRVKPDQKIFDAKLKVEELDYSSYAVLPQKLPAGFYGVEAYSADELEDITWLQVTPLIGFSAVSGGNSIVWIKDHKTKDGIAEATISYRGRVLGATDVQGLATFPTPQEHILGTPENEEEEAWKYPFAVVTHGLDTLLLSLFEDSATQGDEWWTGLTVDKPIYLPTDSIHFWGFARRRDDTDIKGNEVEVQIRNAYDYEYDDAAYVQTKARIGTSNTFIGTIEYASLRPGYYSLVVSYQGKTVVAQQINIQTYVKPAYTLSVEPDRHAAYAGEKISYTVKANFFDGTPVRGLQILYTDPDSKNEDTEGKSALVLNADGQGTFTTKSISHREDAKTGSPLIDTTYVEPAFAEEAEIHASASFLAFPARQIMTVDPSYDTKKTHFAVSLHSVDIAKGLAAEGGMDETLYYGSPVANHPIKVKVTRTEYRKKVSSRKYDPYTKTTYPVYEYHTIETDLPSTEIRTDASGKAQFSWEGDDTYSYTVKFETKDEKGVTLFSEHSVFIKSMYEYYDAPLGVSLSKDEPDKIYYTIGQPIRLSVERNDGAALQKEKERYLYLRTVNESISPFISDSPTYRDTFTDTYIPNVEIIGVWFSGDRFYDTAGYWQEAESLYYDSQERALSISIRKDRDRYRPRETVKLSVDVKDPKGEPRKAHVLVSAIDEALKTFGEVPTLEPQIYRGLNSRLILHSTHEHPVTSGAEGGGCFVADTSILTPSGERPIQDLREGDYVLTKATRSDPTLIPARIHHVSSHIDNEYMDINGNFFLTPNHRLLVNNKWTPAGAVKRGDTLLDSHSEKVPVLSVSRTQQTGRVYNIEIENQHTFFAEGLYVHNQEKGGGDESGISRTDFKDTVYFEEIGTNEKGHAEVSFPLPDNLTSWSVKAEAITNDLFTGVDEIGIPVSMPFFVDATLNKTYLAGDQLTLRLRTFGTEAPEGQIKYRVESPTLPFKSIEKEGGRSIELPLGSLSGGLHTLTITASAGAFTDTLVRTLDVRDTYFIKSASEYRSLKRGEEARFESAAHSVQGYATLTACSCDRSRYGSLVSGLRYGGIRLDEQAASAVASELEKKYFGVTDEDIADIDLATYQRETGGFGIVFYGGDDLYSSALIAHAARFSNAMLYNEGELISYLYTSLNDVKADRTRQIYALWGLAALRKPILVDLQPYLNDPTTTLEERVYLASALATLGAHEKAKEYYQSQIKNKLIEQKPFLYVRGLKNTDTDLRVTGIIAYLLSALQDDTAQSAGAYLFEYEPHETRIDLERAFYLATLLPTLEEGNATFEYQTALGIETITLAKGVSFHKKLSPEDLSHVAIRTRSGTLNIATVYDTADPSKKSSPDPAIQIQRSYTLKGDKRFTQLHNGDLVKITLSPKIDKSVQANVFQITDYVPSGLRVVESLPVGGYSDEEEDQDRHDVRGYPFLVDGQRVVFDWYKDKDQRAFYYYARVVSSGIYRGQNAEIQSVLSSDSVNYSSEESVSIQ